jgi:hypothetical protein
MAHGEDSERIRERAWSKYIDPQIKKGHTKIDIAIRPLMKELEAEGFPKNHPRQFCMALQKKSFLQEKGLVLERIEGPPSGTSTTVVLHYSVIQTQKAGGKRPGPTETPGERANRLTQKLQGLLKNELAEYGGAEGFIRWIRAEDEDAA